MDWMHVGSTGLPLALLDMWDGLEGAAARRVYLCSNHLAWIARSQSALPKNSISTLCVSDPLPLRGSPPVSGGELSHADSTRHSPPDTGGEPSEARQGVNREYFLGEALLI